MSKKYPVSWHYYAFTTPSIMVYLIYSYFSERFWAREWYYRSEDPIMYWLLFLIGVVGCSVATYRLYVSFTTGRKV